MFNNYIPSYTGYQAPTTMSGLSDFLSDEDRNRLGMSGDELSESFGYKAKYGEHFNPIDLSGIEEGLADLPELQQYLRGNVQNQYMSQQNNLLSQLGNTGFAGTGSLGQLFRDAGSEYQQNMLNADQKIQDMTLGFQNQLSTGVSDWRTTLNMLLQSGAKKL